MSSVPNARLVEIRGGLIPAPGRPSVDPEETIAWEQIAPREIGAEDWSRFEGSIAEIFTAFGLEQGSVSTATTPLRFLKALYGATAGYEGDAKLLTDSRLVLARRLRRGAGDAARVPRRGPKPKPLELERRGGDACAHIAI